MLGRRFLVAAILLLLAIAVFVRLEIADGAQLYGAAGSVIVSDSTVLPKTVTIRAGSSVAWTNAGTRFHQVVADRKAFTPFSLVPGASHRVPFRLPGVYVYTVDRVTKGIVVVIAGSVRVPPAGKPAVAANASTAGQENCGHPKIYHYDIEVTVHRNEAHTLDSPAGTIHRVFDWSAKWSQAPLSVEQCSGQVRVLLPAGIDTSSAAQDGLAAGESRVKIAWDDKSELIIYPSTVVPACYFTDVSGSPAKLALNGKLLANGAGADFRFSAIRINPPEYPINQHCDHRRYTMAPHQITPGLVSSTFSPFRTIDGLDWYLSEQSLNFGVSTQHAAMPFPLNALAHGKGFEFRTGPLQAMIRTNPGESDAVSDWATVTFTPVQS